MRLLYSMTCRASKKTNPKISPFEDRWLAFIAELRPQIQSMDRHVNRKVKNETTGKFYWRTELSKDYVEWLDGQFERWHETEQCSTSITKMLIAARPHCLGEGTPFDTRHQLSRHLRKHSCCIVPKEHAKEFRFTKACLVEVFDNDDDY